MVLVIADDLTGGNATGVMAARQGLRAYTSMAGENFENLSVYDVVIVPLGSRGLTSSEAYDKVRDAISRFGNAEVNLYSKRIDSTLRGNIGSEVDAMHDALGLEYTALVVPAFPRAGRIQTGGSILLNGVPLHRTSVAQDPKNPIKTDRIETILASQSRYACASIFLDELPNGEEYIAERIETLCRENVRAIIIDAADDKDIELIARAALKSKCKFFSVDPGPFTAMLTGMIEKKPSTGRVLVAVGSVNSMAASQVSTLLASGEAYCTYIETSELLEDDISYEKEINRVADEIISCGGSYDICCVVASGIFPERRVAFEPYMKRSGKSVEELSASINLGIGEIVRHVMQKSVSDSSFSGIFTCGGDITIAVCESLGATGIILSDEVIPLASFGKLAGGQFDGTEIVTKGGMVGGSDAMQLCVSYLQR